MTTKKNSKAASGAGTIRQRADGRWEGRYSCGYDPMTGKQIQRSVYAPTQAECRKKLSAVVVDIDSGTYLVPQKLTVEQWLNIWKETYLGDVKPLTVASYEQSIRLHLIPSIGRIKLQALTAPQIQTMYNKLSKQEKPLSPKSIKNLHGVLHRALQQAVEVGYIRFNPADACKLPRVEKHEIKPLDDAQIQKFMQDIKGHKYENIYLTTLFTGMRQGEVLGLQWKNVNFKNNTILIDHQLQKMRDTGEYVLAPTKTDKPRRITVAPFVMDVLREQQQRQLENYFKLQGAWNNEWELVFTNEFGGHLCAVSVYNCFKRICRAAGFEETRFHDLRHTYATVSLENGDSIKEVSEALGHSTITVTADIYAHVSDRMKQESASKMERFIRSVSG